MSNNDLIEKAKSVIKVRKTTSGKLIADVGAALITDKENIYLGVCIDTNEGSGICAERSAIAAMVTAGEYKIKKIVAVWKDGTIIPPCGVCREFMWQIDKENWKTDVIVGKNKIVKLT
ncbi:MAG: cytidine deaminase, partial [Nanoarchaeota archaeon]